MTATPLTMVLMRHSSLSTASSGAEVCPSTEWTTSMQSSGPDRPHRTPTSPHSPRCRHASPSKWRHDSSVIVGEWQGLGPLLGKNCPRSDPPPTQSCGERFPEVGRTAMALTCCRGGRRGADPRWAPQGEWTSDQRLFIIFFHVLRGTCAMIRLVYCDRSC